MKVSVTSSCDGYSYIGNRQENYANYFLPVTCNNHKALGTESLFKEFYYFLLKFTFEHKKFFSSKILWCGSCHDCVCATEAKSIMYFNLNISIFNLMIVSPSSTLEISPGVLYWVTNKLFLMPTEKGQKAEGSPCEVNT